MNGQMKRTFTIALGLVMGAAFVSSAFAQDAFPDTPENHWAYEALANMKKAGLLVGYPDGLYRGSRPASRYEMAVALYALYQHLRGLADGFDSRIKTLEDKVNGLGDNGDVAQLKQMLEAMRGELNGMKAWGDDIANLKKMAATFEKELASMGVDVEALKKSVNDLADRVAKLEKRKPAVDVHGNIGALVLGGYSDDGDYGITVDGRPTGVSHGTGAPSGIDRDLNVFHEGQFVMTGTNDEGPKWKAALAIGNMMGGSSFDGWPGGAFHQSSTGTGYSFWDGNDASIYFQEFNAWWDFSLGGQSGNFKLGRQGHQAGSYFLKRPDTTPYYSNEYWDDGNWMFDGGMLAFNWGGTTLNVFGGRTSGRQTNNGDDIQWLSAGRDFYAFVPGDSDRPRGLDSGLISADTMIGAGLGVKLGSKGSLNLNYIMLNQDEISSIISDGLTIGVDRAVIFGGELNFGIGNWMLNAGYSQSDVNLGDTAVIDQDNSAYWASLGTKNDKWGANVGWRHIDPLFNAPGDWGRIGIWWNPSDIEGFWAKAFFNVNSKLMIHGSYEMYEGTNTDVFNASFVGLSSADEVSSAKLDLVFNLNDSVTMWLGGEWVNWDLAARLAPGDGGNFLGGETEEVWYNVGFKYRMGDKAWWSIKWQISDYDSKGTSGMNPFSFFSGSGVAKGGLITSTLGIKF